MKSRGRVTTTVNEWHTDVPMVNWPKYGLTVPLAVWEQRLEQKSEELAASRPQPISAKARAKALTTMPQRTMPALPAKAIPMNAGPNLRAPSTRRVVPETTAKARDQAALQNQTQAFAPNPSMNQAVQISEPSVAAHNTVTEHFNLAIDDNSSVSSWSLAE